MINRVSVKSSFKLFYDDFYILLVIVFQVKKKPWK